jgi:hypothetical protein
MVPWDGRAGAALAGVARVTGRRWQRSPLMRAASRLARHLSGTDDQHRRAGLVGELAHLAKRTLPGPTLGPAGEGGAR